MHDQEVRSFVGTHCRQKKIVADLQCVGQRIVQVTVCPFWDRDT